MAPENLLSIHIYLILYLIIKKMQNIYYVKMDYYLF